MYRPLISFTEKGGEPDDEYSHIWRTHYCQMQLGMKILNKNWCDYIVYCPTTRQLFIQRVPFNETFWSDFMFPKITTFLDETDVLLKEQGINSDVEETYKYNPDYDSNIFKEITLHH